jgi:hypothetical protein
MTDRIGEYYKIFHFTEPLRSGYNIAADQYYSKTILENLRERVLSKGISFDFPDLIGIGYIKKKSNNDNNKKLFNNKNKQQFTLMDYM